MTERPMNPVLLPTGGASIVAEAEAELPQHAKPVFRKDVADLLRAALQPTVEDVEQSIALAIDLAKRGAVSVIFKRLLRWHRRLRRPSRDKKAKTQVSGQAQRKTASRRS